MAGVPRPKEVNTQLMTVNAKEGHGRPRLETSGGVQLQASSEGTDPTAYAASKVLKSAVRRYEPEVPVKHRSQQLPAKRKSSHHQTVPKVRAEKWPSRVDGWRGSSSDSETEIDQRRK